MAFHKQHSLGHHRQYQIIRYFLFCSSRRCLRSVDLYLNYLDVPLSGISLVEGVGCVGTHMLPHFSCLLPQSRTRQIGCNHILSQLQTRVLGSWLFQSSSYCNIYINLKRHLILVFPLQPNSNDHEKFCLPTRLDTCRCRVSDQ